MLCGEDCLGLREWADCLLCEGIAGLEVLVLASELEYSDEELDYLEELLLF